MQETWVQSLGSIPGSGKIPWRRKWQPTPVFLPGESHGRRSLVGYSPRGRKELDTTEQLHFHMVVEARESALKSGTQPWRASYAALSLDLYWDTGEPWKNLEQRKISDLCGKKASCPVNCHCYHQPLSSLPALFVIYTLLTHLGRYISSFPLGWGSQCGMKGTQINRHMLRSQWFLENQVPRPPHG